MNKFREEFRIESSRLPGYDYSSDGSYFITICTKDRKNYLGEIEFGNILLSEQGKIAEKFWNEIPVHFPMVSLDAYIIMPDHLHGIIIIKKKFPDVETRNLRVSTETIDLHVNVETRKWHVSTSCRTDPSCMKSGSISSIINQFKRICTITINRMGLEFAWQPRFYDRIIRNPHEMNAIRKYIINNAKNFKNKS